MVWFLESVMCQAHYPDSKNQHVTIFSVTVLFGTFMLLMITLIGVDGRVARVSSGNFRRAQTQYRINVSDNGIKNNRPNIVAVCNAFLSLTLNT